MIKKYDKKFLITLLVFTALSSSLFAWKSKKVNIRWKWGRKVQITFSKSNHSMLKKIRVKVYNRAKKQIYASNYEMVPVKYYKKILNGKNILFFYLHSGGESGGSAKLQYIINSRNKIIERTLPLGSLGFKFAHLNRDRQPEITIPSMKFASFSLGKCDITPMSHEIYDDRYLFSKIYQFKKNRYVKRTFRFKRFHKQFLKKMERILKKEKEQSRYLLGLVNYFYVAKKIGLEKRALNYIKRNSRTIKNQCLGKINSYALILKLRRNFKK